jgi:hypothetical protein
MVIKNMSEKNKKLENGGDKKDLQTKSTLEADTFERIEEEKRNTYFTDLQEVVFYKNDNNKLMGRLTNGKYVLLHKSEDSSIIEEGLPYICILRHLEKVAFAKIISPVFLPRAIIRKNGIIFVHKDKENPYDQKIAREKLDNIDALWERIEKLKIEKFICIKRGEEEKSISSKKRKQKNVIMSV